MNRFNTDVMMELTAMKEIGMHVPDKALKLAQSPDLVRNYGDMKVSECADLLIQLAGVK